VDALFAGNHPAEVDEEARLAGPPTAEYDLVLVQADSGEVVRDVDVDRRVILAYSEATPDQRLEILEPRVVERALTY
jgi:hypothetical protein